MVDGREGMKFVASLSMSASDLRQALRLWDESGDQRNPFARVLVSPLFTEPSTLRMVREELKGNRNSTVYFDSGGYYVQQGRLEFEQLYGKLMKFYRENRWADWYVLPDWVPTSRDDRETVEHKVRATVTVSRMFYEEMPDELKPGGIPVVHAHSVEQAVRCVEAYSKFAAGPVGFGSFGTSGSTGGINMVTQRSVEVLRSVVSLAATQGLGVHLFGVGTPPILYLFHRLGVKSFDSMAWMRAAGFGNVFLPFVRGYMTTYRIVERTHIFREGFERLKAATGHRCVFCDDFVGLSSNRMYRAMHNLASVLDTLDAIDDQRLCEDEILGIIAQGSPTYLRYYRDCRNVR